MTRRESEIYRTGKQIQAQHSILRGFHSLLGGRCLNYVEMYEVCIRGNIPPFLCARTSHRIRFLRWVGPAGVRL